MACCGTHPTIVGEFSGSSAFVDRLAKIVYSGAPSLDNKDQASLGHLSYAAAAASHKGVPSTPTTVASISTCSKPASPTHFPDALTVFLSEEYNKTIINLMMLSMERTYWGHVQNCNSSGEAIDKLDQFFDPPQKSAKFYLMSKLEQTRMEEGPASTQRLQAYYNEIATIVNQLRQHDVVTSDDQIKHRIKCALPSSFNEIQGAIDLMIGDSSLADFKAKLLEFASRCEHKATSSDETNLATDLALSVRPLSRFPNSSRNSSPNQFDSNRSARNAPPHDTRRQVIFCRKCRTQGHSEKQCRKGKHRSGKSHPRSNHGNSNANQSGYRHPDHDDHHQPSNSRYDQRDNYQHANRGNRDNNYNSSMQQSQQPKYNQNPYTQQSYQGQRDHQPSYNQGPPSSNSGRAGFIAAWAKQEKVHLDKKTWVVDSGCGTHITPYQDFFYSYEKIDHPDYIYSLSGRMKVAGIGNIMIDRNGEQVTIHNVLHVPKADINLLSVRAVFNSNPRKHVVFEPDVCKIMDLNGRELLRANVHNNLNIYTADLKVIHPSMQNSVNPSASIPSVPKPNMLSLIADAKLPASDDPRLWHCRLAHANYDRIKKMANGDYGFTIRNSHEPQFCEHCAKNKSTRKPFPQQAEHAPKSFLDFVTSDVCGPFPISRSGKRFIATITDAYSRRTWIRLLAHKSEVFDFIKWFNKLMMNQLNHGIKILRTDNGGEYISKAFNDYCAEHGIQQDPTATYSPEQNGISERLNRTIVEAARTIMDSARLPSATYWPEAVDTANYIHNRTPNNALNGLTPYEVWYGYKPNLSHLRIFGCIAYAHINRGRQSKVAPNAQRCLMLGYVSSAKSYRLKILEGPGQGKITASRNVIFDESTVINKQPLAEVINENLKSVPVNHNFNHYDDQVGIRISEPQPIQDSSSPSVVIQEEPIPDIDQPSASEQNSNPVPQQRHYPLRSRAPSRALVEQAQGKFYAAPAISIPEKRSSQIPSNPLMALNNPKWKAAMNDEFKSHQQKKTWTLVDRNAVKRKPIGSRWVFTIKDLPSGEEKYKARFVAKGYTQRYGDNFTETFSPVAYFSSILATLSLIFSMNMTIDQFDVKTAYLNAPLHEEIYLIPPEGFGLEGKLCKLNKAIYGLKQAGREWNKTLSTFLKSIGLRPTAADGCIYYMRRNDQLLVVIIYVDDLIVASNDLSLRNYVNDALKGKFELTQVEPQQFLGLQIQRDKTGVHIHQSKYISELLDEYDMSDCRSQATPYSHRPTKRHPDEPFIESTQMRKIIGKLLYLSNRTRPDIAAPVAALARYQDNASEEHWKAAKQILRYLRGTINLGIHFNYRGDNILYGYADADFAGDTDDRKSTSGIVFMLNGGPIHWKSKKQSSVSLSTTESEFISACDAAKDAVHLHMLLNELGFIQPQPIHIYEDNQATIKIAHNETYRGRLKHLDLRYHYIRELIEARKIDLIYCDTHNMIADILTKPLQPGPFLQVRNQLGLVYPS